MPSNHPSSLRPVRSRPASRARGPSPRRGNLRVIGGDAIDELVEPIAAQLERERAAARVYAALPPKCVAERHADEHLLLAVLSCFHHDAVRHAKALAAALAGRRNTGPSRLDAWEEPSEGATFPQCIHAAVSLEIAIVDGWRALGDAAARIGIGWLVDEASEAAHDADRRWSTWTLWLCDYVARDADQP